MILLLYGYTSSTPGRYLEDELKRKNIAYYRHSGSNKRMIDRKKIKSIIFIESPSTKDFSLKEFKGYDVPKIYWMHHGQNHLKKNKRRILDFKPDLILMSHSLHLAKHLSAPVKFFPFATDTNVFKNEKSWSDRKYDLAFVGRCKKGYEDRKKIIDTVARYCKNNNKTFILKKNCTPSQMSNIYKETKIVINPIHDTIPSINMRLWEAMGSGCLCLSQTSQLQETIFQNEKHYVTFNNNQDISKKMTDIFNNLKKYEEMSLYSYNNVLDKHLYSHRVDTVLKYIDDIKNKEFLK